MNVEATTLPTQPTPFETAERWCVLIVAALGVALAVYGLFSTWQATGEPLEDRLDDAVSLVAGIALLSITWLIAWRAGRSSANLAIALAITAVSFNNALAEFLEKIGHSDDSLAHAINTITFIIGAGLYVRATQRFPVAITREAIESSTTIWGRWRPLRAMFTTLLAPAWLWITIGLLSMADIFESVTPLAAIPRLLIIGLGIAYFHINYRGGHADVQRRVLWFLAWAVVAVITTLITLAVRAVLGSTASEPVRVVIGVSLAVLNDFAQVFCIGAAVFYVGAISPLLVIRKTMVFGLTTALLLFVFASVEVFLHHQIVHLLGVTDTFASSLLGGAFGLAFHPVKHYFEHLLGRVLARRGHTSAHK